VIPGFITKDMIKQKKKQIVNAEKIALLNELNLEKEEKAESPQKKEIDFIKKKPQPPTPEELALEHKKKVAAALKNIIKSGKDTKEKSAEKKVFSFFAH